MYSKDSHAARMILYAWTRLIAFPVSLFSIIGLPLAAAVAAYKVNALTIALFSAIVLGYFVFCSTMSMVSRTLFLSKS